jgi:hypothetical protein
MGLTLVSIASFAVRPALTDILGTTGVNSDSGCCGNNAEQLVYFTNIAAFPTANLIAYVQMLETSFQISTNDSSGTKAVAH